MARGDIVAFLDDDAVADANWLKFFMDSYSDPAVAGVGGLTLPSWGTAQPSWFPTEFYWVVGCSYVGMPTSPAPVRNLFGGNASFRREIFDTVGGFTGVAGDIGKNDRGDAGVFKTLRDFQRRIPGTLAPGIPPASLPSRCVLRS